MSFKETNYWLLEYLVSRDQLIWHQVKEKYGEID